MNPGCIEIVKIMLPLAVSPDQDAWKKLAARQLDLNLNKNNEVHLLKHSIDVRQKDIKV